MQAPVAAHDRADRQLQLTPPLHVGEVAERADHRDARTLLGIGEGVSDDGHLDAEQRSSDRGAEKWLVTLIIRVCNKGNAGR